jgi:hypothetical protein
MSDDDKIAEALGLRKLSEVLPPPKEEKNEVVEISDERFGELERVSPGESLSDELIEDIEEARNNVSEIIRIGMNSLEELTAIAKQSEAPRAFEVAAAMMETLLNANKEIISIAEKKKFAKEDSGSTPGKTTNVTNNNLILSTADLLKMMKGES